MDDRKSPFKRFYRKQLKKNKTWRKCLGFCDGEFLSEGPHHRICPSCKANQDTLGRSETPHQVLGVELDPTRL